MQPAPAEPNRVQKKKIWEGFQPLLKTDDSKVCASAVYAYVLVASLMWKFVC
jgi:hypothetical protein